MEPAEKRRKKEGLRDVVALDGRGERVMEAVRSALAETAAPVDAFLDMASLAPGGTHAVEQAFKAELKRRVTTGTQLLLKLKETTLRINRSKNKTHLEEATKELGDKQEAVQVATDLCKLLLVTNPPPESMARLISRCRSLSIILPDAIKVRDLHAACRRCLQYEKYDEMCCNILSESGDVVKALVAWEVPLTSVMAAARQLLEEFIMNFLRSIKDAKSERDKKAVVKSLASLCTSVLTACRAPNTTFLASVLQEEVSTLRCLLLPDEPKAYCFTPILFELTKNMLFILARRIEHTTSSLSYTWELKAQQARIRCISVEGTSYGTPNIAVLAECPGPGHTQ